MKQLGVVMSVANLEAYALSEGVDKSWQSMTQAEQALIRYNYILANTVTSQGDVARSAGSYAQANKQLELSITDAGAAFGEKLLPSLTQLKSSVAEFISSNKDVISFIGNLFGTVGDVVMAAYNWFKLFGTVLNTFLPVLNDLAKAFNFVVDGISS